MNAHNPYTTEGTPANTSMKGRRICRTFPGAYSAIYTAVKIEMGIAISNERPVTMTVPMMMGKRPKEPFSGFQRDENKRLGRENVSSMGSDLMLRIAMIRINIAATRDVRKSMSFMPMKSRSCRLSMVSFYRGGTILACYDNSGRILVSR
jgi:hypothetical protein